MAERKRQTRRRSSKRTGARKASKPTKAGPGRPEKIAQTITFRNPTTQMEETITTAESILRALRIGVPQKYAARAAGVDETTVGRWIARGREALVFAGGEPEDVPAPERDYADFADGVVRAKGAAVAYFVGQLHRAAKQGNVRAAIEWLRAQAPDEFKQKVSVDFDGERKPPPIDRHDDAMMRAAWAVAFGDQLPEFDPAELAPPDPAAELDEAEEED